MTHDELIQALKGPYNSLTNIYYMKQAAYAIEELIKERDNWKTTAKLERDGRMEWFENYQQIEKEKEELLWCINYMATCDNCKYFGGCCCDHVDEDGYCGGCCCNHVDEDDNCLGWELLRKPTEEERKAYDEYMEEAVRIAKQVLEERELEGSEI